MSRRTLAGPVAVTGTGLHTGATTTVRCLPAPAASGVRFRRVDLDGQPEFAASVDQVDATERRTALGRHGQTVDTVEHLLAAVTALELDDLLIEVDGPEAPILDGSFQPYLAALESGGIAENPGDPTVFTVATPFTLTVGEASYVVAPAKALRITATIEWDHPLIGRQVGTFDVTHKAFRQEIAAARTFGFAHEVDGLRAKGLLKGATVESAVVMSEDGVLNGPLRWADEFVRHKVGDIVGDLGLTGGRLRAHVIATRPSHEGNVALARMIVRSASRRGGQVLDIRRILEVIPHRYPFLLVDRILEIEPRKRVVGLKNVTINEPFFQGHFPDHPIMPGVLIVESMAQVGGMLLMDELDGPGEKVVYFMSLDNIKFRRPVVPGDQIRQEVEMVQLRGRTCRLRGLAYVDGQLVCEADMMAMVVDK
ncbi:MAG: bifunctional UDP-3-O-[3-hydroxymyristoyl] N-acetylglucosamine deacetylase/3-hydroxyacyl-ACP dehydratase [Gemmatimonadetes bacterium]|nr:bifunctional UDP-3-O-[3-hydroxymyristoyl] N-acetylglucosamine deacetylase/3-hydroxyacyl-ACP dehydratase [Gemmatimonadota bacterium]